MVYYSRAAPVKTIATVFSETEKPELYYQHPACDVYFNCELNTVQTHWKGIFCEGEEFRTILNKVIELLALKKFKIVIADAREMKIISNEDQKWIIDNWYPRALKAGFDFEVLIVSKDTFNERSIKKIVFHYDDEKVKTVYFYAYAEAKEWIKNNIQPLSLESPHV